MPYSNQEKALFYEWWIESNRSYVIFSRRFRKERGKHEQVPALNTVKEWRRKFRQSASLQRKARTKPKFA